jgi:hypothetical protein
MLDLALESWFRILVERTDVKALKVGLCECESVYINEIVCVCEMLKFKILVERTDLKSTRYRHVYVNVISI